MFTFNFNAISITLLLTGKKTVLMKQHSLPHVAGGFPRMQTIQFCTFIIS